MSWYDVAHVMVLPIETLMFLFAAVLERCVSGLCLVLVHRCTAVDTVSFKFFNDSISGTLLLTCSGHFTLSLSLGREGIFNDGEQQSITASQNVISSRNQ